MNYLGTSRNLGPRTASTRKSSSLTPRTITTFSGNRRTNYKRARANSHSCCGILLAASYLLSPSLLMEKGKSTESVNNCFCDLSLNSKPRSTQNSFASTMNSQLLTSKRKKLPPSLLSLCLGVVGSNLEDIMDDLADVAATFPSDIKMALVAIARRRKLLNDDVVIALAEHSWEILDISDSDVSDIGLSHIVTMSENLRAVDISQCRRLTSTGISELLERCHSLEILRWGGCSKSEYAARCCLSLLKPSLSSVEGESWEDLDTSYITCGVQSLRWLVWPKIDKNSLEALTLECPRILVNPKPSPLGFTGAEVPQEAIDQYALDGPIVKDIDPKTWAVSDFTPRTTAFQTITRPDELSIAEKFRLAFVERDTRLAPKRAKNARQHQRRAEREWVTMNSRAKALALASQATRSAHLKNS